MVLPLSNYLEDRLTGKDLLIFDFDGTVASTTPLHNQAFIDTLSPFNMPVDYSSLAGLSTRDAITLSFNLAGRQPPNPHLLSTLIRKNSINYLRNCIMTMTMYKFDITRAFTI